MIKKLVSLFEGKHYRYIIVGIVVFGVNIWVAQFIFSLEILKESPYNRDLANLLSLEIALLFSYLPHKWITWLEGNEKFLKRLVEFHLLSLPGIFIRIFLFGILNFLGFHWMFSTILSTSIVILINFVVFDNFVFNQGVEVSKNQIAYSAEGEGVGTLETIEEAKTYNSWIAYKFIDYLGEKNIELGAGTGTIAEILSDSFPLELFELSDTNKSILVERFKNNQNIVHVGSDIMENRNLGVYDCIYSSNVLEHIENEIPVVEHCLRLLKKGGFFAAVVPAMPLLYSRFDSKIGHFRRYSGLDKSKWEENISKDLSIKWISYKYFNPIGAFGWFVKMKLMGQSTIKKQDAMIMNSLIPFIAWLDYLPLPFGQSIFILLKKK